MPSPLLTPEVLHRMVQERLQLQQRGELTWEFLRGYVTAMFHAGAITSDELHAFLAPEGQGFNLTPPASDKPGEPKP